MKCGYCLGSRGLLERIQFGELLMGTVDTSEINTKQFGERAVNFYGEKII